MTIKALLESAAQRPLAEDEILVLKKALVPQDQIILTVKQSLYPLAVIHRAIYWLADEMPLLLEAKENGDVAIIAKIQIAEGQLPELQQKLMIALNDFTLRLDVEQKTTFVREALIQTAFSEVLGKSRNNAS